VYLSIAGCLGWGDRDFGLFEGLERLVLRPARPSALQPSGRELMAEDIRWQQRFSNYCKALERLEDFLEPPALNEREQ
jgi:hypothetical protein